jgi:DDE superfamily endonuclease
VHDLTAARIWGILTELAAAGLITLADKGYQGAEHARTPYKGRNKPQSQKDANRTHAGLRSPGERPAEDLADLPQAPLLPLGAPGSSPKPSTP